MALRALSPATVGCHVEVLDNKVLLALPSLDNLNVELHGGGKPAHPEVQVERFDRSSFLRNFPQLKERAERRWGITSLYLTFSRLQPGDELKISGDTLGQRVSFYLRRIREGS